MDGVPTMQIFVPEVYKEMTGRFKTCDDIVFKVSPFMYLVILAFSMGTKLVMTCGNL